MWILDRGVPISSYVSRLAVYSKEASSSSNFPPGKLTSPLCADIRLARTWNKIAGLSLTLNSGNKTDAGLWGCDVTRDWQGVGFAFDARASEIRCRVRRDRGASTGSIELVLLGLASDTMLLAVVDMEES